MKKLSLMISAIATVICMAGCKKDKTEPSFVNDYDAPLTEAKGVEYSGDYFPLEEGFYWDYSGREQVTGEIKITGGGYNETEPIDETSSVYSYLVVNPLETVNLNSGTYSLFPVKENYSADGYSYRYFEKANDAVYFRAYSIYGEEKIEVENPIFIKIPLVVGDSWETQPSIDLNSALTQDDEFNLIADDIEASIICKIYVIGKENISWNDQSAEPIRLDELAEANISIPLNDEGTTGKIDLNLKMTNTIYALENTGIIKQKLQMNMTMNVTMSAEGETGKINMTVESNGELNLGAFDVTAPSVKNTLKITDSKGIVLNINDNPIYQKTFDKGMKVINKVKKVITF